MKMIVVFRLSVFSLNQEIQFCVIMLYNFDMEFRSLFIYKLTFYKQQGIYKHSAVLCKSMLSEMFCIFLKKLIYKEMCQTFKKLRVLKALL